MKEPNPVDQLPADFDPVCVPAHPVQSGGRWGVNLELRRLQPDVTAAVVYTSPDALADALGEHQPWIAMPMIGLRNLVVALGVHRILVDPKVEPEVPRWTEGNIRAVTAMLNGDAG
ncbi:SAV_915 family protein [Streptomyces sp. NPDC054933]